MLKMRKLLSPCDLAAAALSVAVVVSLSAAGGGIDPGNPPPPPPPPPVGEPFDACGTIHLIEGEGIMCVNFETATGDVFLLSELGKFGDGDDVCVTGEVFECFFGEEFLCGSIAGCVTVKTITPDKGGRTLAIDDCGTVEASSVASGCLVFAADSGGLFSLAGSSLNGQLKVGDRIHVTGTAAPCASGCGDVDGCINQPRISPCPATGDLNGDGVVNTLDLGILLSSWSIPAIAPGCAGAAACPADLNGDGHVNSLDLGVLLSNWG